MSFIAAGPHPRGIAAAAVPRPGHSGERIGARLGLVERMFGAGSARSLAADGSDGGVEETCRNLAPYYGCSIDTIVVTGNTRTKSGAILREMATKRGSCLDEKLIRRDAAFLRGLGYFAEVNLDAEQSAPGACRLIVSVVDRPGLFMRFPYPVVNYDFEKGLSYGFTWKVKNFRGNAENLSLSAIRRQEKEQGAGFSWSNPWFAGRRVRLGVDAGAYRRMEEPGDANEEYVRERVFAGVGVGVPLSRNLVRQIWFKPSLAFEARDSRRMLPTAKGRSGRPTSGRTFSPRGARSNTTAAATAYPRSTAPSRDCGSAVSPPFTDSRKATSSTGRPAISTFPWARNDPSSSRFGRTSGKAICRRTTT